MFKFALVSLAVFSVLFFSNKSSANIFVQGGVGANTYINKDTQETSAYYPIYAGYSFRYFDLGGYFGYSSLLIDHKKSTTAFDDLNVYSVGAFINYKPIIMGDFTPFVGLGLTYNIFNGEYKKYISSKDVSQDYLSKNNCTLEKDKNNEPYYICSQDKNFNNINLDIRAGLQYEILPNFSLVGTVTYSVRLNNNNEIYKNYNSLNYVAAIRFDFN